MAIQKTEWGHIEWLHMPDVGSNQTLSIGFTEMLPGHNQAYHVHYGQEQFLYILEGQGQYIINGVSHDFQQGDFVYIEPDSTHETINTGDDVLREILISNSVSYLNLAISDTTGIGKGEFSSNLLYGAIEAIRMSVLEQLKLPVTIFDTDWKVIWHSRSFPVYCVDQCQLDGHTISQCPCMQKKWAKVDAKETFICPFGLTVFNVPIMFNDYCLGTIRSGHVLKTGQENIAFKGLYDTPQSSIISIQNLLHHVVQSILTICQFNISRQEILESDGQLQTSKQALVQAKDIVTNLKINHHFLFNILNSMAEMAISSDNDELYDSITNLARMLRYTMTTDFKFVPLQSELEYLTTYLELQKLRYRDQLDYVYDIDEEAKAISVPFNFLQPVVENAFTHGFKNIERGRRICVAAVCDDMHVIIKILNNGQPINRVTLNRVKHSLKENTGHGLSFIYEKLRLAYGDDFDIDIERDQKYGTCVSFVLPKRREH